MSTYLRKCIDIAPTAVITPGPFVANDYRNLRQKYVETFFDKLVNWDFAGKNFA